MYNRKKITTLEAKYKNLVADMKAVKKDIAALSETSLELSEEEKRTLQNIKEELSLTRAGTWGMSGPGSDKCEHCTAGGGN